MPIISEIETFLLPFDLLLRSCVSNMLTFSPNIRVQAEDDKAYSGNICMADMQVAMKLAPELLGQEAVLNQERICLAQHM